ncbi:flagellar protein FlaG [Pseudomonas syringae]|uniref:Flagellar protein FlaG n=1 Tax=Pseudomonas syringae TaxID=317 RepID=A0A1C7Z4F6_PSESX|nr:flagellar protein FlaG [Pseudomonas syringae]OCR24693.1 flagellar protein FlaG [Pseudomonas syringae]
MDMSVKLGLSYQAVKPVPAVVEQTVTAPQAVSVPAPAASADSSASKDSSKESDAEKSEKLKTAVQEIEKFVQSVRRNLEFSIDEASGEIVVKVIASDTGEVVRQLPSAEALKIADSLHNAHSLLFDAKA